MHVDRRLYQALLRNDFRAFTEKVFITLNPGEMFVWNWYIDAIAWHLELVRRGEIKRLIINMPPRSQQLNAKTLMRRASRLPADWTEQRTLLGF